MWYAKCSGFVHNQQSNPDNRLNSSIFRTLVNTSLYDTCHCSCNSCYRKAIYFCTRWCDFHRFCVISDHEIFYFKAIITWHITCILLFADFIRLHCTNTSVELQAFLLFSRHGKPMLTEIILAGKKVVEFLWQITQQYGKINEAVEITTNGWILFSLPNHWNEETLTIKQRTVSTYPCMIWIRFIDQFSWDDVVYYPLQGCRENTCWLSHMGTKGLAASKLK